MNRVYAHYDYLKKHPVDRNIDSMIASRKDGVKSVVTSKKSFVYVERLGGAETGVSQAALSDTGKKPVLTVKAEKATVNTTNTTAKNTTVKKSIAAPVNRPVEKARQGQYTVQLASFPDLRIAREMEESLKSKTYPAYIETVELPGKGTWYRVKVGGFTTEDEAKKYGNDMITAEPDVKSIIVTLN